MINLVLPGNPTPLRRHRHSKYGTYNPQKKEMLQNSFIIKSQYNGPQLTGPLSIDLKFYIEIPKSYSKKRKLQLDNNYCTNHKDIDNY